MNKQLQHPFFVIMGPSGSGKTAITSKVFPKTIKLSRILRGKNDWMKWMVWITILKQKQVFKP